LFESVNEPGATDKMVVPGGTLAPVIDIPWNNGTELTVVVTVGLPVAVVPVTVAVAKPWLANDVSTFVLNDSTVLAPTVEPWDVNGAYATNRSGGDGDVLVVKPAWATAGTSTDATTATTTLDKTTGKRIPLRSPPSTNEPNTLTSTPTGRRYGTNFPPTVERNPPSNSGANITPQRPPVNDRNATGPSSPAQFDRGDSRAWTAVRDARSRRDVDQDDFGARRSGIGDVYASASLHCGSSRR